MALRNAFENLGTEATQLRILRGLSDYEVRFDYGSRTDANPVRVGKALNGTATNSPTWNIQTFTYDDQARLLRVVVTTGAWS